MSERTREDATVKFIQANPTGVQQAANVPGMAQFNITRDRVLSLINEMDTEEAARILADVQQQSALDANTANDAANKTADDARSAQIAAESARALAQDAAHDNAITAESARAKAEEARNAAADAQEIARVKALEATNATALAQQVAALATEVTARQNADTAQGTAIAANVTAIANNSAADAIESQTRANADTANANADATRAAAQLTKDNSQDAKNLEQDTALTKKENKIQKVRGQTAADGTYNWTYSTPFAVGVIPNIKCDVEAPAGATVRYSIQIQGTPTNTSVAVKVVKDAPTAVNLVGLTLLGVPTAPGTTWIHLTASEPT